MIPLLRRLRSRSGQALVEFTFVGIPLIFVLISIFEVSRGMWIYHTLAYSVKNGVRYASVHGINCVNTADNPNDCSVTLAMIATVIRQAGVGLDPTNTQLTFNAAGSITGPCALNGCASTVWPPNDASGTNAVGKPIRIDIRTPFKSAIAMFWPGSAPSRFANGTMALVLRITSSFEESMSRRKKTSGGQAIVMVTLTLFSMVGMMGLSVDLGWSYFAQKQAQAAADTAAVGAVQEAVTRLGGPNNLAGFTCGSSGSGSSQIECTEAPGGTTLEYCGSSVASTSNLNNGCLYAKRNGFQYGGSGSRQIVSMQSGDVTDTNAPGGIKRMSYWVRVRTIQTIPQLFSVLAGNRQGTIAANGTAAIAGAITPGSFFGMNHRGDCWSLPGAAGVNCGMDLDNGATGSAGTCPSGGTGSICAPAGIILASNCNAAQANQCSQAYAGDAGNHHGVETSSLTVATGAATPGDWHNASGTAVAATQTSNSSSFRDPTYPNPQPPLQASSTMASCGVKGSLTGNLGPFQYYHYTSTDGTGKPIPDGLPLTVSGTATFLASGTCPNATGDSTKIGLGGSTQSGSSFPTYVFYGGVTQSGTTALGPGQYVMAGINSGPNTTGHVFDAGGTITGDTTTGTMMIFTDANYPGLSTQRAALPNVVSMPTLYQGDLNFKNPDITMSGVVNSSVAGSNLPASMDAYTGVVWWQDRRNSMVEYNQNPALAPNCSTCTKDDGSVVGCFDQSAGQCSGSQTTAELVTDNHVTANSPGVTLDPGNGRITLTGVYYQPRGGWLRIVHGNGSGSGGLQIITGSAQTTSGTDKILLSGPTNPLLTYKALLIQ